MEPELVPHPGPRAAPAAAAGTGIRGESCLRYRLDAATTRTSLPVPVDLLERAVRPDDELVWNVFPAFDEDAADTLDGYRAAGVAVDVLTDDGRRLLSMLETETDRTPAAAAARVDLDFADQWNERRLSLKSLAGATIVAVEFVADIPTPRAATGVLLEGWLDGIRVEPARYPGAAPSPAERVPTTRGSHSSPARSRGLTQPMTGVPHGGIHLAPATDLSNPHWTYSWNAHGPGPNPSLAGLLVTRSPSIWVGDRGAIAIRIGLVPDAATGVAAEEFSHDDEIAMPHRYRLTTRSGIRVDAAATDHAAVSEITFPSTGRVVLCAPGGPLTHVRVRSDSPELVHVEAVSTLASPHEPDPVRAFHSVALSGARFTIVGEGESLVIDVERGAEPVRVEIGSSQLSQEQAEIARARVGSSTVEQLAQSARRRWDVVLASVDPVGGTDEQRVLVTSDLYRLFLFPTRHDEDTPNGPRYPSPTRRLAPDTPAATGREIRAGRMLTDNGFWDTYRTAWPAYALLAPRRASALLDGVLEHVRDAGWSPRWTAGTPLDAMVGTSLDVIAADLVEAGVPGIDLDTAYRAALRNATAASTDARFGRRDMPNALLRGFVDADVHESVSWTLEGAISDAGAAVLARALGRRSPAGDGSRYRAEARYLAHRALAYRNVWDPTTRFFRPRDAEGNWADEPFDPRVWGGAHTETNAWGNRFAAPHDGAGLAELFGGRAGLGAALDEFFREQESARAEFAGTYPGVIHEMPEARDVRRGMFGLSNQPAHHVPWLYAHSDRPWRADEVLTDAALRMFRGVRIGQGYPGDEDNGEMSAWHLFTTLGFAPFAPGSGTLLVTAPQLERSVLRPDGAAELEVVAHRRDPGDRFIRSVRRNGAEWTAPSIGIAELHEGGTWEVELGPHPVPWSEPLDSRPHFAPDGVTKLHLRDVVSHVAARTLNTGDVIDLRLEPTDGDPALLVLGLVDAGLHSFSVEAGAAVTAFGAEDWTWPNQARPFEIDLPADTRHARVRWHSGSARLAFVQVLV